MGGARGGFLFYSDGVFFYSSSNSILLGASVMVKKVGFW